MCQLAHCPPQLKKVGLTIDSFREYTNTDNDTMVAPTLTNEEIVQAIIDKRDPPCHSDSDDNQPSLITPTDARHLLSKLRIFLSTQANTTHCLFDHLADLEIYTDSLKCSRQSSIMDLIKLN